MSKIPKHEATPGKGKPNGKTAKCSTAETITKVVLQGPDVPFGTHRPSMQHDINHVEGLSGVEESLDWIAKGIGKLTNQDQGIHLTLAQGEGILPVKITLADNDSEDTMGRLVTAFERIADSVAKLAGLSRPRLEWWHEQEAYQPPFRDSVPDGGLPGPKATDTGVPDEAL